MLLGDIRDGKDADLLAARDAIQEIDADILLLTGVDTDYDGLTATALAAFINAGYDFTFTEIGNTGVPSGFDLDRDGRFGEPEDALSFGRFRGEGGMALLSRHPIDRSAVTSFTDMRWIDVPDTRIPRDYFTETEIKNLTVSSRGHWIAPVQIGDMRLNIMAFHATTPAFDGAEDRNGGATPTKWRYGGTCWTDESSSAPTRRLF